MWHGCSWIEIIKKKSISKFTNQLFIKMEKIAKNRSSFENKLCSFNLRNTRYSLLSKFKLTPHQDRKITKKRKFIFKKSQKPNYSSRQKTAKKGVHLKPKKNSKSPNFIKTQKSSKSPNSSSKPKKSQKLNSSSKPKKSKKPNPSLRPKKKSQKRQRLRRNSSVMNWGAKGAAVSLKNH